MRCSNCGMPLSPTRSHCPRCGSAAPDKTNPKTLASTTQAEWQKVSTGTAIQAGSPYPLNPINIDPNWETENNNAPHQQNHYAQSFPPIHNNDAAIPFLSTTGHTQDTLWESQTDMSKIRNWHPEGNTEKTGSFLRTHLRGTRFFTPRLGFSIAGACIAVGTILLILVFFIARTLPKTSTTQAEQQNVQATKNTSITPSPTFLPTPSLAPSTTPTLEGKKYFDNAQIGSEINNNTAQIITQGNTFRPNQRIYVTFQVHTGNQLGAACLLWYWGNKTQTHFEFPLQGSNGAAYSFMPIIATGTGKVEIYYASTTTCTDKILAQSINFTVNPA